MSCSSENPDKLDSMTSHISLEALFDSHRLQGQLNMVKITLYFPFGLLLLLIRLLFSSLGLLILSLLPRTSYARRLIFRGICKVLGLIVQIDDKFFDRIAKLIIANHVSVLDRLAVNMMIPCNTIRKGFQIKDMNEVSCWKDADVGYSREITEDDIITLLTCTEGSAMPILNFPEDAMTNGKVGLLRFHPGIFSLNFTVQPVLIRIVSSFITISPSVLGSKVWLDILWLFFLPYTIYSLKILPSIAKLPNESLEDFSKRVQQSMANGLGAAATNYTSSDKVELVKRLQITTSIAASPSNYSGGSSIPELNQYSSVSFQTENAVSANSIAQLSLNTAAKTFGKTPKERMLSYQERKQNLIKAVRLKYLVKHNIK
ncbi:Ancient ubiquitous protein 1, partial [Stegodyphus mimosarum]